MVERASGSCQRSVVIQERALIFNFKLTANPNHGQNYHFLLESHTHTFDSFSANKVPNQAKAIQL